MGEKWSSLVVHATSGKVSVPGPFHESLVMCRSTRAVSVDYVALSGEREQARGGWHGG